MPYADAMKRRYTPDFQADGSLPTWVPGMGGEGSGQDMGTIGGAFKKRLMDGGGGDAPDGNLPYEGNGMPVGEGGMATAAPVAGAAAKPSGGMMKSLG